MDKMKKSKEFPYVEPAGYFTKEAMEIFFPKENKKEKKRDVNQEFRDYVNGKEK